MVDKVEKWYQREGWKFDMHWDLKGAVRAVLADPECNEATGGGMAQRFFNEVKRLERELEQLAERNQRLEAQLTAALRDKERLEWIGNTRSIVYENHESRWVCYVYRLNESGVYFWGDTMREAIDAAMSSSQPPTQLCANCGKPYDAHLLHDGNKCEPGSISGWFPKSVADALTRASQPPAQEKESQAK